MAAAEPAKSIPDASQQLEDGAFAAYVDLLRLMELSEAQRKSLQAEFQRTIASVTPQDLVEVMSDISNQKDMILEQRRLTERLESFRAQYQPADATVYSLTPSALAPSVRGILEPRLQQPEGVNAPLSDSEREQVAQQLDLRMTPVSSLEPRDLQGRIVGLDLFTPEFCESFIRELEHFERAAQAAKVPLLRPNSMNRDGFVLKHVGTDALLQRVFDLVVKPLAARLYTAEGGDTLDDFYAFVVRYRVPVATGEQTQDTPTAENPGANTHDTRSHTDQEEHSGKSCSCKCKSREPTTTADLLAGRRDQGLAMHVDNADVTLNVCLSRDFEDGDLLFHGIALPQFAQRLQSRTEVAPLPVAHVQGRGLLHLGAHRHSAEPITAGERVNLIMWCSSSSHRAKLVQEAEARQQQHAHSQS